jgi:hypothetical protein
MELNGPLFDGIAARAARDMARDVEQALADQGQNMVLGRLIQVIRKPTPYYWTQIEQINRRGGTEVTGESVIYHWWLEGVGSRNFPVTRFKGYRSFEITARALAQRAESVAEPVVRHHMPAMGGA